MLGQILDADFVKLLGDITEYFRVQEQNNFESYDINDHDNYENHDFLKYIDLALAMSDGFIKLDFEIAVRLMHLTKYAANIGCSYSANDMDFNREDPSEYESIEKFLVEYDGQENPGYQFILYKYEYQ